MKLAPWHVLLCLLLLPAACNNLKPNPRPRAYPRIVLPEAKYQKLDQPDCPYTLEYSAHAQLESKGKGTCYYNLVYPQFGAVMHLTLRDFRRERTSHDVSFEDYRRVIYKHSQKAEVRPSPVETGQGRGFLFELYGQSPQPAGFYFSDTSRYALIDAVYFRTAEKNDSLAPVIDYLKRDMHHMLKTLQWR